MHLRRLLQRYGDAALAGGVAVIFAIEVLSWPDAQLPEAVVTSVLAAMALAWRRVVVLPSFLVAALGSWGTLRFADGLDNDSLGFLLVFFVSLYSLGRWTRGAAVWVGMVFVLTYIIVFVVGDANAQGTSVELGAIGFGTLFVGTPWAAGVAIRLRRERERTLVVESEQAIARERARIARELHDVVSHAISVTVLQARGGRTMIGRDEEAVRDALDAIEQTNTAALSDMRRLLAVLRDTDSEAGHGRAAPQPSLANLERLVEQVRRAGLPIDLSITGEPGPVPPGVDLSAYRIVQESLTNVMKHSGEGATATVTIAYSADDLRVTVVDDGRGAEAPNGSGHGLAGIRERVAVVGGTVVAEPAAAGGFEVRARLPFALESLR
ncbi:sensor histidine kinase [Aeromicrobium sp.]|uniref:sensor histidine kinase n=1 Tax=Aeromicrobium sp. TaxID=1871063 RepID=UPI003C3B512C